MRARIVWLLLVAGGCNSASQDPLTPAEHGLNVLFIGNSLTYSNDLPATVAAIAESAGDTLHAGSVTAPNFALIDHVNGGTDAMATIMRGGWDFVVVQQGPTSFGPGPDRDTLVIATKKIDEAARAAGARTAVFMVWPTGARFAYFDNVRDAYRAAADEVDGVFLPAGEAWRIAWDSIPDVTLYSADAFHPSEVGSYLAALVIHEGLTGKDARTLPDTAFGNGRELSLAPALTAALQAAAHQAVVAARASRTK